MFYIFLTQRSHGFLKFNMKNARRSHGEVTRFCLYSSLAVALNLVKYHKFKIPAHKTEFEQPELHQESFI